MADSTDFKRADYARFEADGVSYVFEYTTGRVMLYEDAHSVSLGSLLATENVFLKYSEVRDILAYCIREEGGEYVNPERGREMAGNFIEANGYIDAITVLFAVLAEDCGFLFKDSAIWNGSQI